MPLTKASLFANLGLLIARKERELKTVRLLQEEYDKLEKRIVNLESNLRR